MVSRIEVFGGGLRGIASKAHPVVITAEDVIVCAVSHDPMLDLCVPAAVDFVERYCLQWRAGGFVEFPEFVGRYSKSVDNGVCPATLPLLQGGISDEVKDTACSVPGCVDLLSPALWQ